MRFSITLLESFRRFQDGLLTEAQLIARVRGLDPPTWRVFLGRAYDALLRHPDWYVVPGGYRVDGPEYPRAFVFEEADVAPALEVIPSHHDPERFQPKREHLYGAHTVVGLADYLAGLDVAEFKTRVGDVDLAGYLDSMQWRFLLDLFDADTVTYQVFRLSELSEGPTRLLAIETLPLGRYPALHDDCAAHVEACARWAVARGLWGELQQPRRRAEAPVRGLLPVPTRAPAPRRARPLQPQLVF